MTDNPTNVTAMAVPEQMQASVLSGIQELRVEPVSTPSVASDEVLVRVAAVGVCGSDTHYFRHGRIGDFVVEAPLILGHEVSGRIVAVGSDVSPARIGERVAVEPQKNCRRCRECRAGRYNLCRRMEFYATPPIDGAFAQYCVIRTEFAHTLPDPISDEAAALLEPLSVAITTMRKAGVAPGSSILIAGAGPIGIICAQTARAFGAADIIVTDLAAQRRDRALTYGATRVIDPRDVDVASADLDVHAFVDASGSPEAVFDGIKAVRPAGTAVLVGLGASEMTLPIEHIQNLEITVTGIFRYADTWPAAIHLVASGQVDLDSLVTGRFDLEHAGDALNADLDPAGLKAVVYPN
ncbi:MAG: NAD(P)-dependent alcohol dehydrogenase [Microlunatus sp.]|nr:NAD(P)-dependent alcohol dehydrogenase [Microlunatus sp.]